MMRVGQIFKSNDRQKCEHRIQLEWHVTSAALKKLNQITANNQYRQYIRAFR